MGSGKFNKPKSIIFWVHFMEKAMAPHSSTLAWKIPWMEEPGRLQSWGRWVSDTIERLHFTFHFHALEKEMATHSSVLAWRIPGTGEPSGLPSMGSHRVGHDWSDLAAAYFTFDGYLFFCPLHEACRILVPWPGIEPVFPALRATTELSGKSNSYLLIGELNILIIFLAG